MRNFFNRSVFLYMLVGIVVANLVHWQIPQRERERYLLGILTNGGFKNYYDGVLYFDTMVNHFPDRTEYYRGLGTSYFNLKMYDRAWEFYRIAVLLAPKDADLLQTYRMIEGKLNEGK